MLTKANICALDQLLLERRAVVLREKPDRCKKM
jgi:hypothetical protein